LVFVVVECEMDEGMQQDNKLSGIFLRGKEMPAGWLFCKELQHHQTPRVIITNMSQLLF
jgi:hypothetical protein